MPRFSWREEEMSYSLIFFPLVGAVIGLLIMLLNMPAFMRSCPLSVRVPVTLAIPLFVTGGFHVDGFMDTEDALRSYASPERKLEILKDPHVGAFAVIGLIKILLVFGASTAWYRHRAYRLFGGVTGDTAGHFLVSAQTTAAAALAAVILISSLCS